MTDLTPQKEATEHRDAGDLRSCLSHLGQRLQKYKRWLPVLSFVSGVVSALLMRRGYERMYWLLGALFVAWGVAGLLLLLGRRLAHKSTGLVEKMHFGALVLAQSASQEVLFFVLPFYYWSTTLLSANVLFFVLLLVVATVTLIDPVYERLVAWPPSAMTLLAITNFAALNFALPVILGLPNSYSIHLALLLTVLLTVLFAATATPPATALAADQPKSDSPSLQKTRDAPVDKNPWWPVVRTRLIAALATSLALTLVILGLGLQRLIPPAPLRLMHASFSTGIEQREPVDNITTLVDDASFPDRVYCYTAIQAPRGLDDEIVHVWLHDGEIVNTVPLKGISGGRKDGFRTWSYKSRFPRDKLGEWSCEVRTAGDQIIGRLSFEIQAAKAS